MAIVFYRPIVPATSASLTPECLEDLPNDMNLTHGCEEIYVKKTSLSRTAEKLLPKTVECPGCGSSTLLQSGESKACSYCDSPLTYPL